MCIMHKLMLADSIRNDYDDDITPDSFTTARTDHLHVECHHSLDAILGTNLFRYRSPLYFGTFHTSLFTMFQVLAEPSWCVCLRVCMSVCHIYTCMNVRTQTYIHAYFHAHLPCGRCCQATHGRRQLLAASLPPTAQTLTWLSFS